MLATFPVWALDDGIRTVKVNGIPVVPVGFTEPSEQVMVIRSALAVQPVGSVDATARVRGSSLSVTTTFVAVFGPGFLTVTVYVTRLFGETEEALADTCEMSRQSLEPHISWAELVAVNHARAQTIVTSRQAAPVSGAKEPARLRWVKRSNTWSRPCLRERGGEGFPQRRP
jgi:hypothetical protein